MGICDPRHSSRQPMSTGQSHLSLRTEAHTMTNFHRSSALLKRSSGQLGGREVTLNPGYELSPHLGTLGYVTY